MTAETVRVNLFLNSQKDPELFREISGLPSGRRSSRLRDLARLQLISQLNGVHPVVINSDQIRKDSTEQMPSTQVNLEEVNNKANHEVVEKKAKKKLGVFMNQFNNNDE